MSKIIYRVSTSPTFWLTEVNPEYFEEGRKQHKEQLQREIQARLNNAITNNLSLNSAPQPGAKRRRTMTSTNNNNNTSNNRSSSSSSSSGSSASSSPASNGNVISRMTVPIVGFRSSNVNGSAIAQPGFRRVVLGKAQGGGQKHTGGQK